MKNNRRKALQKIALGTAAVTAITAVAPTRAVANKAQQLEDCSCDLPASGPLSKYFTNAVVQTHQQQKKLFYNDLLKDKIVMINFMSIATEENFQSTQHLLRVQELLGERLGKDYFMYSITTEPTGDTVSRLNEFAKEKGVKEGWSFITGSPEVMEGIKARFFLQPGQHRHSDFRHGPPGGPDCSMGLVRYGNVKTGTWGSVPSSAAPDWIIKRLEWIHDGKQVSATPKRRGPFAIVKGKPWLYDSGNYRV